MTLHVPANEIDARHGERGLPVAHETGRRPRQHRARHLWWTKRRWKRRLRSGHLGAAGLDVLRVEPMVQGLSMLELENLVVTPHVAASTAEGLRRMAWDAAGNVLDFLAGRVDRDAVVNGEVLKP